jgi:hypothetical protein
MPPSPARLPSVPSPGSARAANAGTPALATGSTARATTVATSHGSAAPTAAASVTQTPRQVREHTSATTNASSRPVGVSPARAIQNTRLQRFVHDCSRSPRKIVHKSLERATQGRQP